MRPFIRPDSVPLCLFCACIDFMGSWRNLTVCKKQSAWERGQSFKHHTSVLSQSWSCSGEKKWFLIVVGNLFMVLVAFKCLQSQLQSFLCTILYCYLYHNLGILFLARICFSRFLFYWRPVSSVNWLQSFRLLERRKISLQALIVFLQLDKWKHSSIMVLNAKEQVGSMWPEILSLLFWIQL